MEHGLHGNEVEKCRHRFLPYITGCGLDIGCNEWPITPDCEAVDLAFLNDQVKIADWEDRLPFPDEQFDWVFSAHCLEHIGNTERALQEARRVLKAGGHLCLYLPHRDLFAWCPTFHEREFDEFDLLYQLSRVGKWWVKRCEVNPEGEYSFDLVAQKRAP